MKRYVYQIGECADRNVVGGKGASLTIMKNLGLNVPPGLTITTHAWQRWKAGKLSLETLYDSHVRPVLMQVVPELGKSASVSVRSGAASSMPGMMETILHLGAKSSLARLAYLKSYIKASGLDESPLEKWERDALLNARRFRLNQLESCELSNLLSDLEDYAGPGVKGNGRDRMLSAIRLVFESWDSPKAHAYREQAGVNHDLGTACTVQQMVSGFNGLSGVLLTRGAEHGPQIDWLPGVQGDVIVDGRHATRNADQLREHDPSIYQHLIDIGRQLEHQYHDAMDVEFTFDGSQLYILQCRTAKRTKVEAMRIAVQLYDDGLIDHDRLRQIELVDDSQLVALPSSDCERVLYGSPVLSAPVSGNLKIESCSPEEAEGQIVVREMTTTSDIELILKAKAIVTLRGGPTCHAALVAREFGIPAIVGVGGEMEYRKVKGDYVWALVGNDKVLLDGAPVTLLPNGDIVPGHVEFSTSLVPGVWSARLKELLLSQEDSHVGHVSGG